MLVVCSFSFRLLSLYTTIIILRPLTLGVYVLHNTLHRVIVFSFSAILIFGLGGFILFKIVHPLGRLSFQILRSLFLGLVRIFGLRDMAGGYNSRKFVVLVRTSALVEIAGTAAVVLAASALALPATLSSALVYQETTMICLSSFKTKSMAFPYVNN